MVREGAGGPVGVILGGGAGTFAVPALIRSSLIEAYKSGTAQSSGGFLNSVGIILKTTAKEAAVGALTFGAGAAVSRTVGSALAPAIGQTLGVTGATRAIGAAGTAAEIGTMVVAPAALDGHLPEPEDFLNAAIVVLGAKGAIRVAAPAARSVAEKIGNIYSRTGIRPEQVVADAKSNPEIATELAADGAALPRAYKPAAEAELLANALPEAPKVAEIIANPRGTLTDGKQPNHINYRYVEAAEDVVTLRARIAEVMKGEIEAARGKESWDQTQAKAERVIKDRLAGMTDAQKAEMSKMTFSDLAAQSMAVEAMAQKAAFDARQAAADIAAKGDTATPADHAKLVEAIETSALLHQIDQANGTEVARALNARKAARQRAELAEGMGELLGQYGTDPHLLARMVLGLHTTEAMTRFSKSLHQATKWEMVVEAWKAGILSGPVTHMANVIGNTTFMALRPVIDVTAAAIGRLTGAEERVSAAEPLARAFGNIQGAKDAMKVAGESMRAAYGEGGLKGVAKEIISGAETAGPQKVEQFRHAIPGVTGDIVRMPFRLLSLADEFFKMMNARGEAYALATRQAISDGLNVSTREFRERVADLVQNDVAIQIASKDAALRFTFNKPLGEFGQSISSMVKAGHLEMFVPFIRTPGNILKELIRLSPGAPLVGEWRAAIAEGGARQAQALAEVSIGTAIMGVTASFVFSEDITGQGSPDAGRRRVTGATGKQPYSFKIGDTYYNYQRLQPVGTLIGMAADMAEIWDHMTETERDKVPKMIAVAFGNAVTNQTFLQGITNIINAISDPNRYGSPFARQMAGSVVPAIIAQPTTISDPYVREVNSILDAIKARIPGARDTLMTRKDIFGEPMQTRERLGGVSPITTTPLTEDKVRLEADRLGLSVAGAPRTVHIGRGTGKLGDVKISDEQRNEFTEVSGKLAHQILEPIVTSPNWEGMGPRAQKRIYERAFTRARRTAAMTVFPPGQREALVGQITERVQQELRP